MRRVIRVAAMLCLLFSCGAAKAAAEGLSVSVENLFPLQGSDRQVYNFNTGWLFKLGEAPGAEAEDYDDSQWETVATPHCVKLEPAEASGGRNYQGVAWYRKHFTLPKECAGMEAEIYFEAIMGKQRIYVNGKEAAYHEGGYLPIVVHLNDYGVKAGDDCVVAVMADNSNDKSYPPGKPQYTLDFAYHGGIYRDVWLVAKNKVHITTAVEENEVAGGGIFVHYDNISKKSADVFIDTEIANNGTSAQKVTVEQTLTAPGGKSAGKASAALTIPAGKKTVFRQKINVKNPALWSPDVPSLYSLATTVKQGGKNVDGGITKIGIRSFEFRGHDGFWLNGNRYRQLVGANRHQDFAYVGNAVPNSQQWRDVQRLKQAGCNIIRTAHYPQDPSFMDACDELGIFIIVATPGWQYWNKDPEFEKKVQQNTRLIIRRNRNHPCVLMWEPILNETRFPESFALDALQITKDEYPWPGRPVAAADMHSAGVAENYDLVYGWPDDAKKAETPKQCIFTREYSEIVDDWYAHNCINRTSRSWGEQPMLLQALSHAQSTKEMFDTKGQFLGGCLWHPFDHQRGYHPDPYWGGLYDAFRQPKTNYYMFHSQLPQSEPVIHIAHEMMPSSGKDVVVFTNCDSVRLSLYDGEFTYSKVVDKTANFGGDKAALRAFASSLNIPENEVPVYSAPVIFENAWDYMKARDWSYKQKKSEKVNIVAEGYIGGKVVCRDKRMPSRRSTKLRLYADEMGKQLIADGSDFIVVVAEVTDDSGHVRRLAKEEILFTVEGEGRIIGDASIGANPRTAEWGSAPVLVQSTTIPGTIRIHAEVAYLGTHAPSAADLEISSVAPQYPFVHGKITSVAGSQYSTVQTAAYSGKTKEFTEEQKRSMLKEVEQQQADFGTVK